MVPDWSNINASNIFFRESLHNKNELKSKMDANPDLYELQPMNNRQHKKYQIKFIFVSDKYKFLQCFVLLKKYPFFVIAPIFSK